MKLSLSFHVMVSILGTGLLLGCHKTADPVEATGPVWFEDVTAASGVDFVQDAGPVGDYFMPQITGSGAALFDFNNDGLLDIYLLNNGGPKGKTNCLYQQLKDGTFKDVSAGSGLDIAGNNMGVAVGDVNNDGWPDVLVTQYCGVKLFLNNGNGTFTDVTEQAGLKDLQWAVSASFFDCNRDGWLDLVVVNYVDYNPSYICSDPAGVRTFCAPKAFPGTGSKLFRNKGLAPDLKGSPPRVRFEDVSLASGLGRKTGPGLGVLCADFNGDGWPDVFVANDGAANHLWINQLDGTFQEEAIQRGLASNGMGRVEANMGVAVGDVDGDGLFDVFVTHLSTETHTLWKQGPRGVFTDQTTAFRLSWPKWRGTGFGTVLADFDNDGFLDLALVNGGIERNKAQANPDLGPFWKDYAQRNGLFRNEGGKRFADLSPQNPALCGQACVSRGLAVGDLNNDGAFDLLVTQIAGPARLYRNVAPDRGHWLLLRALDPRLRRDAYGAEITVQAGQQRWWRLVNPGSSFACSNDPRVHVGLGAIERVDAIEVLWPDGLKETFPGCVVDRQFILKRGSGVAAPGQVHPEP